jgi:hypothetical protein
MPFLGLLERHQRPRLVEVEDTVELLANLCAEVVAETLRLGAIDDSNRALEAWPREEGALARLIAQ